MALRALERAGGDGKSIIALSAPASKRKTAPAHPAVPSSPPGHASTPSQDPISALASGVGRGAGVGPLFGTTLLVFALAFFSLGWLRYRRRGQT